MRTIQDSPLASSKVRTAGRRRSRGAAGLALLASVAVGLSACGGDDGRDQGSSKERTVDAGKVESALKETVTSSLSSAPQTSLPAGVDLGEKVEVRSVDCPDDVPMKAGQAFKCGIDADPYRGEVNVKQLDGNGRALSIHARLRATLKGVSTRRELSTTITFQGKPKPPSE